MALSRILGVALEEVDPIARAPFDIGHTSGQPGADRIAAAAAMAKTPMAASSSSTLAPV